MTVDARPVFAFDDSFTRELTGAISSLESILARPVTPSLPHLADTTAGAV